MSKNDKQKRTGKQERTERMQGQNRKVLGIGLGLTFAVALLSLFGAFSVLELKSIDKRFEWRGPRDLSVPACVVAIDDESLNGWATDSGQAAYMPERWIWPRDFHARVLRNLKKAGAKIVAFDIVFSESSRRNPEQDKAFADAAKEVGNVVFAERHVPKDNGAIKTETLIPGLFAAKLDKGHANVGMAADGALRGFLPLYYNSAMRPDPSMPNLDIAVLRQLLYGKAVEPSYDEAANVVTVGSLKIPLNNDASVDVNFGGPPETVPTFPYHHVYYETMDMSVFKGKVVYIGSTSEILHDNHRTAFHPHDLPMPGVEAHVHFLDTLLSGAFIRHVPGWVAMLIILGLGLMTSFLTFRVKAKQGTVVMLIIFLAYAGLALWAFAFQNLLLPMAAPLSSVVVAFAGLATYRGMEEEKRARTTRQMFSKYVSKQIVDEIMKDPNAVQLGGEVKETTILFSDVRGFTAMSEKLSAPEVVEVLNEYLTAMVDIVIANGGTLDKYVGDAIMAVWGSPLYDPQHRQNAMRTAVQMMEVLQELQAKWLLEGKPHIDIGIGLNTGHVVAGNMGHPDYKMDYTVIGDDVNLAARMESANKEMKSHILVTGSSLEGCEDMVDVIRHPPIHVKGKEKEIEVYEVIGWKKQGRAPWATPLP